MYRLFVIALGIILSGCNANVVQEDTDTKSVGHSEVVRQQQITPPSSLVQKNFTDTNELKLLSGIEAYLRNTAHLIDEARAYQDPNGRYQFSYELLKRDLADIANSINRYVNDDKMDQTPKSFSPLTKRY